MIEKAEVVEESGASLGEMESGVSRKIWAWTKACSTVWQQDIEQARILPMPGPSWPHSIGASSLFCVASFCEGW